MGTAYNGTSFIEGTDRNGIKNILFPAAVAGLQGRKGRESWDHGKRLGGQEKTPGQDW